jgi:hypothetical protein
VLIAALSAPANAANVTSFEPKGLISALQNAGYKAALSKSDDGDPLIDTSADGNPVRIAFADCQNHQSCSTIEFVGVWDCNGAIEKCKSVAPEMNNEEQPMHLIVLDSGKKVVTYQYLLFDDSGVSEKLFIKNFESFSFYDTKFNSAIANKN